MLLMLICSLVYEKKYLLEIMMVNNDAVKSPDLIVILEGGGVKLAPTRERVFKALELYKKNQAEVLVCAYKRFKGDIIKTLLEKGVKEEDLSQSNYNYVGKKNGGTFNNVLEIISVLKSNKNISTISIVTSPYHERRVSIIFNVLIRQSEIKRNIYVQYAHINNSEIVQTDLRRFVQVIIHETLGVLGFYAWYIYTSILNYNNR